MVVGASSAFRLEEDRDQEDDGETSKGLFCEGP
jgi:hypothetical protein